MDPKIWKNLSTELIIKIVEMSSPSIDVRLSFGIGPKKLDESKCWRLWYFLKSHDGLVYNLETKSLHIFRIPGHHIIRRPIELNYHTAGLLVFNDTGDEHIIETIYPNGNFSSILCSDSWLTEARVIFRGSNPSRPLTIEDAMLLT
jgi:hypothetical protein